MPKNKSVKITPLLYDTYLAMIKNSVNARVFRNFYAKVGGKKKDILNNGDLSCAFFVSSVLHLFQLIKEPHATVSGTVKDMENSGWRAIKKPKPGSVILWEALEFDEGNVKKFYRHLGFYISNQKAISNSTKLGRPKIHHLTYGAKNGAPNRKIEKILWHKSLKK